MISDVFRRLKHRQRQKRAIAEIDARPVEPGSPHGLPAPLIVSLTSYPARFGTLAITLKAILRQSVRPDKVILWLAEGDEEYLPPEVAALKSEGLEVAVCPDWRSYKKIVPALLAYPDSYLVTADDDLYYMADWLDGLVRSAAIGYRIAGHRAHRVSLNKNGVPCQYEEWQKNIKGPQQSHLVFLTGGMGTIYAPGALHSDVINPKLFMELCPSADDIWLYWMYRLSGIEAQKIGDRIRIVEWEGSQAENLRSVNLSGRGNDRAIQAMLRRYGWPG